MKVQHLNWDLDEMTSHMNPGKRDFWSRGRTSEMEPEDKAGAYHVGPAGHRIWMVLRKFSVQNLAYR